jgi:NAD(P)-dependent dehydrogenase (short-subunit alcohol dehydrogenase family)
MFRRDRRIPPAILITGASTGIGLATARLFHERGWRVVASMRNPADAAPWMQGDRILVTALDVVSQASVNGAVAEALDAFGRLDVAFCNAGYGLNGPLEGATEEQMERQFDVNVLGVIRTMKGVLPHMRERREGLILTYIASKHAVEGLIESARFELAPFGVRLKLIEPGGIRTDFSRRSADWTDHPDYAPGIEAAKRMSVQLLEGAPDPSEVARVVYRAVRDRSNRLRYPAKPGPYLTMYGLLPDPLWRGMIETALRRAAN